MNSSVRHIQAKIEVFDGVGTTPIETYTQNDKILSFDVQRLGDESKFFGYTVCQRLNIKLFDKNPVTNISTANTIKLYANVNDGEWQQIGARFYITEIHKDEKTDIASVTAYDALKIAERHSYSELEMAASYTLENIIFAIPTFLGYGVAFMNFKQEDLNTLFAIEYPTGGNFDGSETLREVLTAICEATQSICYVRDGDFCFRRLSIDGAPDITLTKEDYITFTNKNNRRLSAICSATELGDNVIAESGETGTTQYIRDNPLWELREDIDVLVANALTAVQGLTICQFDCSWRGNLLSEIGDKISIVKGEQVCNTFLLNDTIEYNGGFTQKTSWNYIDNENESVDNPATLGEALRQTYARVDKANKNITLLASENKLLQNGLGATNERLAAIELNTNSISATVQEIKTNTEDAMSDMNESITTLTAKVEAQMTAEDVQLQISNALSNGVDSVTTTTGFTFNQDGLTVSKSGSEMSTTITEDGMTVYRDNTAVLTANNTGVDAVNLHASTYLIIGTNSRFEDYGSNRTGCFWIS